MAILTVILLLGGVMSYVFVVAYLSFGILKAANLPRVVGLTIMSGYMPIGMILLCGATTTQLIPTNFLGTTIYSGLNIGIICSIVNVILVTIYVEVLMRTCRKKGIGWDGLPGNEKEMEFKEEELPGLFTAILPVIIVVLGVLIMINVFKMDSTRAIVIAQTVGSIILLVMNWNRIKGNKAKVLSNGAHAALWNNIFNLFAKCFCEL